MERGVLSGLLGKGTAFRLVVDGDWTPRECDRMIALLQMLIGFLKEDDPMSVEVQRERAVANSNS